MTRTLIDADDELLDRARALLGTATKKDTVNAALAQVIALDARRQFREGFEPLAVPDEMWHRAKEVQAALASRSAHRGAALPDLLIAATAERHRVTVLHYDHQYDLIASVTGQQMRWIVPRGTADTA